MCVLQHYIKQQCQQTPAWQRAREAREPCCWKPARRGEGSSAQTVRYPCGASKGTEPSRAWLLKGWPGWSFPVLELLCVEVDWLGVPALWQDATRDQTSQHLWMPPGAKPSYGAWMQSLAGSLQGAAADSYTRFSTKGLKCTLSAVRLYRSWLQANTVSEKNFMTYFKNTFFGVWNSFYSPAEHRGGRK